MASRSSSGVFPAAAAINPDDAAKLTTSYSLPVGLASAKTVQLDVKATFAADSDTVTIQVQRGGSTVNETLSYDDFVTDNALLLLASTVPAFTCVASTSLACASA